MMMNNAGPNFYGNPSFGGTGNYGMGGYTQLAHFGLNPATEAIADQEQEELEQNIEDQEWINNKYRRGFGFNADEDPVPHWNGRVGSVETVAESAPYDNSVSRMRDLPGFPAPNTLVEPKTFTPQNAGADYENPIDGRKVEYLGPTLNGVELDDATGNFSALALELSEELIGKRIKKLTDPDKELNKLIGPDPDIDDETEHKEDAAEIILYDLIKELAKQYINEILGAPKATTPDRLGWNNTRTNSLAAWRNHISPDQPPTETWRPQFGENAEQNPPVDYVPAQKSPLGGFGSIGWPKQFVPADYEATFGQDEGFGEDLLGARRLRQSPTDDDRVGVNASIREAHMKQLEALLEYLLNEEVLNEGIDEGENAPTNPSLWSRAKAQAKKKFKVYPSAYANAWASKWYKGKGGGWRKKGKKK